MPRHIACLTFDFDVWSVWTAWGMTTPTPVSRGEFGLVGADRLLKLFAKYQIKTTWFTPGVIIDTHPEIVARIVAEGHELAHHGYSHVAPAKLSPEKEEAELARACESIKRASGRHPKGYRSPAWDLSRITLDLLIKYGIEYDSSMMGHDHMPYYARQGDKPTVDEPFVFGTPSPLLEMPISWSLDDFPHFEFVSLADRTLPGLKNTSAVLENWVDDFEYMQSITDWGALTYTCHPFVIGRGHRMMMLERLIKALSEKGAVFMRLDEAADEFKARG